VNPELLAIQRRYNDILNAQIEMFSISEYRWIPAPWWYRRWWSRWPYEAYWAIWRWRSEWDYRFRMRYRDRWLKASCTSTANRWM
jgi:hypothetical protein